MTRNQYQFRAIRHHLDAIRHEAAGRPWLAKLARIAARHCERMAEASQ